MRKLFYTGLFFGLMVFCSFFVTGKTVNAECMNHSCVNKTMAYLGINKVMRTDPALIKEILEEDMRLADLESVQGLFRRELRRPVSLRPMLRTIRRAIIQKQPAVAEFLCAALDEGLIPKVRDRETAEIIKRVIHHTYILNELTLEMAENYAFMVELNNHILLEREKFGIPSDLVGKLTALKAIYGGQMFGPTKIASMDLVNQLFAQVRYYNILTPESEQSLKDALKLNILEASVTENLVGYTDNAMTGAVLAAIAPASVTLEEGTRNLLWDLSQEWDSVYETWNLAFITGNATYLQVYFPKLLIPAVIDADRQTYISNRAMSLWLSLNFRLFAALSGKSDMRVPNAEALTAIWGEVNYGYAEDLALDETGYPIYAFAPYLDTSLDVLMEYMKASFSAVPLTEEEQAALDALYETP